MRPVLICMIPLAFACGGEDERTAAPASTADPTGAVQGRTSASATEAREILRADLVRDRPGRLRVKRREPS